VEIHSVKTHKNLASVFAVLAAVIFFLIILTPYFWMLLVSFKSTPEIMQYPGRIWPIHWVMSGYVTVITAAPFFNWFFNSVIVTGSTTLLVLFTSSIAGFVFAKYTFRWKNTLFWFILASMMVPFQTIMIPNFLMVDMVGLYDKLLALIIPVMISGFGIFLCRQFCEDIPDSLCEAAKIDGAGDFYIYARVIIPLLRPCLAALAIFSFLDNWNEYLRPLIMLESVKSMTLPVALSFFTSGTHTHDMSACMAAAAMIMMPVTIVFLCFQKNFIKGITISGIK